MNRKTIGDYYMFRDKAHEILNIARIQQGSDEYKALKKTAIIMADEIDENRFYRITSQEVYENFIEAELQRQLRDMELDPENNFPNGKFKASINTLLIKISKYMIDEKKSLEIDDDDLKKIVGSNVQTARYLLDRCPLIKNNNGTYKFRADLSNQLCSYFWAKSIIDSASKLLR